MNAAVNEKMDLLSDNLARLNKEFWLENNMIMVISAMALTESGREMDKDRMKECLNILKKKMGVLSDFRAGNEKFIVTKMSLQDDPEAYIDKVIKVYDKMQKGKIIGSSYFVLSAIAINDFGKADEADSLIEKAEAIVKVMKKKHPFLTGEHDICMAIILALKEGSPEAIVDEVDEVYNALKGNFKFHDGTVYALSQVLASYEGNAQEKCEKVMRIYEDMKEAGVKYGKEKQLASLGTLINVNLDSKSLAAEIADATEYLKTKNGFKTFDMEKETRYMFAAMVVSSVYSKNDGDSKVTLVDGTIATVIAEEIALMVTMMSLMVTMNIINSSH